MLLSLHSFKDAVRRYVTYMYYPFTDLIKDGVRRYIIIPSLIGKLLIFLRSFYI
jgi:hypothetical protein